MHKGIVDYSRYSLANVSMELATIFEMLKNYSVDESILQENHKRASEQQNGLETSEISLGSQNTTLFNYIDDQAVLELQRQTDDEIGEIENVCSSLVAITNTLSSAMVKLDILQESALSISLDEGASDFANEKTQIQEDEISKMADILTSLTNHYDQLGEATRLCQSEPDAYRQLDISVLQDDHDHVPDILEDLRECLEIVESVSEETKVRMKVYLSVQSELIRVLTELELFGSPRGVMDTVYEKVQSAETEMNESKQNLDALFKQLMDLAERYRLYLESYNHLVLEVERRRRVVEQQERQQKELIRAAQENYNNELEERRAWFNQHGQYLPDALCPFIFDMPTMLIVSLEPSTTKLPKVSKASIQKAISDIHRNKPSS
ncbi:autophagy-related protein 17 [Phycomyces nitens]|nr:autophagy-related protein 17 [Phycomyces nitens]